MKFLQGIASAIAFLLAIVAGLIVDAHFWASLVCVLMGIGFAGFALMESPPVKPPPSKRPYCWPDSEVK